MAPPALALYVCVCIHMCRCPRKPGEGVRALGTRFIGSLELLDLGCQELSLGPMEEQ